MLDIEIKRGYKVLDHKILFIVLIENNTDSAILSVDVLLHYNESLFNAESGQLLKLNHILPCSKGSVEFKLVPLTCIDYERIDATVYYLDHSGNRHEKKMLTKEIDHICPYLKEKKISSDYFFKLLEISESSVHCLSFVNVSPEKIIDFILAIYEKKMYKVNSCLIENGKSVYLAGDSLNNESYFLLTALAKKDRGVIQVQLQVNSNNKKALSHILGDAVSDLRKALRDEVGVKEVKVEKCEPVINIFNEGVITGPILGTGAGYLEAESQRELQQIKQQEELRRQREETERKQRKKERKRKEKEALERKQREEKERKRREEEEIARRERKEQEKLRMQREEAKRKEKEALERKQLGESKYSAQKKVPLKKTGSSSGKGALVFSLILWILIIGAAVTFFGSNGDSGDIPEEIQPVSATASSENTEEDAPESTASSAQTSSSQNSDTYTNSIGMELVKIPAGEFNMGSFSGEEGRSANEVPVHKVAIEESYYLSKYEVTQEQWREVMGSNPSYFKGDDLPVEQVSWNDVQEFIEKLNEMEGTNKYCLPSEAEWEYACRAGTSTRYYFGDDESRLKDYAWYDGNSDETHPVGQKKPNSWGLYDMHGNVYEWCQDLYHSNYDGAPSDGSSWESGISSSRVCRGGCFGIIARCCRSAGRVDCIPGHRGRLIGFRVLRKM